MFDVDELILEESPIENLQERQRQSQEIQDARASEHRRRLAAEEQRQAPKEKNVEVIQPHSRREAVQAKFQDAYIDLEPDLEKPINVGTSEARTLNSDTPGKGNSDGSLESDLDLIVASLGKQAIALDLESLTPGISVSTNNPLNDTNSQETIEDKYRVTCPTCGTLQYVSLVQQGSKIKCPDCTSKIIVPAPPVNWKPSRVKARHRQFDAQSPLVESDELSEVDRQRRQQTQSILERAEVALSEEEEDGKLYGTDFDTAGFLHRTLGFAFDPVAVGIISGYAVIFALIFAMLQYGLSNDGSAFRQGVMLFCTLTAPALALVFGMPMISAALAQLEAAANQQKRVTDWPSMNIFDHFGDVMAVTIALLAAAIPGYLLGTWLGFGLDGTGRIQITGVMFTTFLLFPVFYLSILDSGSVLQLVTQDVLRSIKEVSEAWGGYYLKTMIAFSATMILWYILLGSGKSPILGAIAGGMVPGLVFFTFQQLGLLADAIGENLSPSQLPSSEKQDAELEDKVQSTK